MTKATSNRPSLLYSNSDVVRNRSCSFDGRGRGTVSFATIQMLGGTELVPTMADAEELNPFAIIQIIFGTDLVPTMAEAVLWIQIH